MPQKPITQPPNVIQVEKNNPKDNKHKNKTKPSEESSRNRRFSFSAKP